MCSLGATWKAGKDILLEDTGALKWWWEPGLMKVSVGRDRREDENQTGEPSFASCLPPGTPADLQDWETASYTELLITLVGLREQQQQKRNLVSTLYLVALNSFHQAPPSMEFSRQEYGSGLPFPSPGHLPNQGMEPESPALAGRFFFTEPPGKPHACNKFW